MAPDDPLSRLLAAACHGDESALDRVLEHCRPVLLACLRALLPAYLRDEVAEDLAQDTLCLIVRKLAVGEIAWHSREQFEGLLRTLAEGQHRDWWKRVTARKRDFRREVHEVPASGDGPGLLETAARDSETPSRLAARHEREHALYAAMNSLLEPDERTAVWLHHVEKLPINDVAAILERTPGSVRMLCSRACKKLRERLNEQGHFPSSR